MTEKKKAGTKNAKAKQLNQTSLLDLFPKKQNTASKALLTTAARKQDAGLGNEIHDVGERHNSPVPVLELAAVAISVEPESSKRATSSQTRANPNDNRVTEPEIIEIMEDPDSSVEITAANVVQLPGVDDEPGMREDNPIVVLESSPVKRVTKFKTKELSSQKATYSIFAPRKPKNVPNPTITAQKKALSPLDEETPYPNEDSQHVRGPQTDFPVLSSGDAFVLRSRISEPSQRSYTSLNTPLHEVIRENIVPNNFDEDTHHGHPKFANPSTSSARTNHISTTIPPYHRSHPIISHLIETPSMHPLPVERDDRLWTEKWRPRRADHVLYNENHAIFLRDWLNALELQLDAPAPPTDKEKSKIKGKGKVKAKQGRSKGAKRQRVVRAVDKKAGRKRRKVDTDEDEDDDWIVSDHFVDEEEEYNEAFSDDDRGPNGEDAGAAEYRQPRLRRRGSETHTDLPTHSKSTPRFTFDNRLTNTILLAGPSGSGKTAAVYACAEELDWEVFEVYPGIGKRNAANLDHLVGDVGKNHLVRKAHGTSRGKENESSIKSLFLRKRQVTEGVNEEDTEIDEVTVNNRYRSPSTDFGFVDQSSNISQSGHPEGPTQVRQSLILLEEVDVLFRDDVNFWPAVVNLIKDCKRPVILTCNDQSLVPIADLPLQDVRQFEPCPTSVATSFLQALCCAEGYTPDRDTLSKICKANSDYYPSKGEHCLDLRQVIQHCQMWIPRNDASMSRVTWKRRLEEEDEGLSDLIDWSVPNTDGKCSRRYHSELLSFGDCHMIRGSDHRSTIATLDGKELSDDVLGHPIVFGTSNTLFGDNYDQDEKIMSATISLSRGKSTEECNVEDVLLRRVRYKGFVREFRQNGVVSISERCRRTVFDMDYLPWIRRLIQIDDEQEKMLQFAQELSQSQGKRNTRNSLKAQHVRTIDVNYLERKGLQESQLGGIVSIVN